MTLYRDFTEGVLYMMKRKIKKGVQILSDLLEVLINKDKQKKDSTEKSDQSMQNSSYLIQQIYTFRSYGYVAIEKYELA